MKAKTTSQCPRTRRCCSIMASRTPGPKCLVHNRWNHPWLYSWWEQRISLVMMGRNEGNGLDCLQHTEASC